MGSGWVEIAVDTVDRERLLIGVELVEKNSKMLS